jgi:H+/Cl- antiporter ClcA
MGALLAASLRAPLTGIVLVLEMTDNYQLILPMIITCLGATLLAQFLVENRYTPPFLPVPWQKLRLSRPRSRILE